jgi:hypothetical protein
VPCARRRRKVPDKAKQEIAEATGTLIRGGGPEEKKELSEKIGELKDECEGDLRLFLELLLKLLEGKSITRQMKKLPEELQNLLNLARGK